MSKASSGPATRHLPIWLVGLVVGTLGGIGVLLAGFAPRSRDVESSKVDPTVSGVDSAAARVKRRDVLPRRGRASVPRVVEPRRRPTLTESEPDEEALTEAAKRIRVARQAMRMADARARFDVADFELERTRDVDAELRARFAAEGIEPASIRDLECRGVQCRIELVIAGESLLRAGMAPSRSGLVTTALDVQYDEAGAEVRVVAFMEPSAEDALPSQPAGP